MDISEKILKFAENQKTIDEKLSNSDFSKSYENGHDIGYSEGKTDGYSDGHTAGVADGKQAERDELLPTLWSAICGDGKLRQYNEAFKNLNFDNTTYKPTKNILVAECVSMYENCSVGLEEEKQVCVTEEMYTFDFTVCPKVTKLFYNCGLFKSLYAIDFFSVSGASIVNANNVFYGSSIQRIEYFYPPIETDADRMFTGATKLSYIGFGLEGEVDVVCRSIKLQDCPLVVESAISLFTHIKNFAGTDEAFKYTITLSEDLWAELDTLGNVSPNGNTWRLYCADLGWNT